MGGWGKTTLRSQARLRLQARPQARPQARLPRLCQPRPQPLVRFRGRLMSVGFRNKMTGSGGIRLFRISKYVTTPIKFSNLREGGITAMKLNKAFALATGGGTGGGDMTKAVYDSNNDGISDHAALADATPWAGITGKPASFPPDSTAMLKSV